MADNDQQMRQPEAVAGAPVPVLITRNGWIDTGDGALLIGSDGHALSILQHNVDVAAAAAGQGLEQGGRMQQHQLQFQQQQQQIPPGHYHSSPTSYYTPRSPSPPPQWYVLPPMSPPTRPVAVNYTWTPTSSTTNKRNVAELSNVGSGGDGEPPQKSARRQLDYGTTDLRVGLAIANTHLVPSLIRMHGDSSDGEEGDDSVFLNNSDRDSEDEDDEFEGALSVLLKAAETLKRAVSVLRLSRRRRD